MSNDLRIQIEKSSNQQKEGDTDSQSLQECTNNCQLQVLSNNCDSPQQSRPWENIDFDQGCSKCIILKNRTKKSYENILAYQKQKAQMLQRLNELQEQEMKRIQGIERLQQEQKRWTQSLEQQKNALNTEIDLVQQLCGSLKVFCRVNTCNEISPITYPEQQFQTRRLTQLQFQARDQSDTFSFSWVFPQQTCQQDIFKSISSNIKRTFEGKSLAIFCYGQTNSGKTYTLEGYINDQVFTESGIIPRVGQRIFQIASKYNYSQGLTIQISCLEIYPNEIFDLIGQKQINTTKNTNNFCINNLSKQNLNQFDEFISFIQSLSFQRRSESRSMQKGHCVYTIYVTCGCQSGQINFVDLACSDYNLRNSSQRQKNFIESSFSTLKEVLQLRYIKMQSDEKILPLLSTSILTKVLQNSLANDYLDVTFFIHIKDDNLEEAKKSLDFGFDIQKTLIDVS